MTEQKEKPEYSPEVIHSAGVILNAMASRRQLARDIGQSSYDGQRDYATVLGYPELGKLSFESFLTKYQRQDISSRIVDLPALDTWKKPPQVSEADRLDTPFVLAWESLVKKLRVFSKLSRVDRISGIGRYGILMIGIRDEKKPNEEPAKGSLSSPDDILFLKPLSEGSAKINTFDKSEQSDRLDHPTEYSVTSGRDRRSGNEVTSATGTVQVHWKRAIHVADNKIDSEVFGTPRLRGVFNRLEDLTKYVGGGAEASWLNMRPGTVITTQPEYTMDQSDDAKTDRQNEIEEYLHGMARMLTLEGIDVKQLAGQIMDPQPGFDVEIALIAATTGIPQRVLLGSAAGELSAAQEDMRQWFGTVAERQTNYAEPEILRPFIDRLIWLGALPEPEKGADAYDIGQLDEEGVRRWPTLFELTEEELSTVSLQRAQSLAALWDSVTGSFIVPDDVLARLIGIPIITGASGEPETLDEMRIQMARIVASNHREGTVGDEQYRVFLSGELDEMRR